MMHLVYLPANMAWVFHHGTTLINLSPYPYFFRRRASAVTAARSLGIHVSADGRCS